MLIGLTLGVTGCATTPPTELPLCEVADVKEDGFVPPLRLPELCALEHNGQHFILSAECAQRLEAYEEVAEANTVMAQEYSSGMAKSQQSYNALAVAGRTQCEIAQIRQGLLQEEKRGRFWDNVFHRTIIAIVGVAAISL